MPLTFRDYLKNDGWIPLHSFNGNRAITDGYKNIKKRKGRHDGKVEFKPGVQHLKELIERDPDLFMQFTDMFKEAGPGTLVGG